MNLRDKFKEAWMDYKESSTYEKVATIGLATSLLGGGIGYVFGSEILLHGSAYFGILCVGEHTGYRQAQKDFEREARLTDRQKQFL